jgi:DNA-3-methyladenine glycosylase
VSALREALPASFYDRPVLEVARELVGCVLSHDRCAGVIVEAEAYHQSEPGSHAYIGQRPRTRSLFGRPGIAYVYRSYGVHACINAVSEAEGVGAAALIRALEPLDGIEIMRERRGLWRLQDLCSGPGKLTQALGIELEHDGVDLARGPIVISEPLPEWRDVEVISGCRIGLTKAVQLPWRYCADGSRFLSRRAG